MRGIQARRTYSKDIMTIKQLAEHLAWLEALYGPEARMVDLPSGALVPQPGRRRPFIDASLTSGLANMRLPTPVTASTRGIST